MNWGGVLASGIAGGATQAVDVAARGLETDRRIDAARILSQINEQRQMRLAEFQQNLARSQQTYNTTGQGSDQLLGFAQRQAEQAAATARANKLAELTDVNLNEATRAKAAGDAKAAHSVQVEQTISDSGNSSLLKAMADLQLADPAKKALIAKTNAEADEARARAQYMREGGAAAGKAQKMDEADKIEYQSLFGEVKTALSNQAKFETEGIPFDKDGKPTPQYAVLQRNVTRAKRDLLVFQMRKGLLDAEDMANQAVAGETDSTKIGTAIAQAYELGGTKFGDDFFAAVRKSGALERNAEARAPRGQAARRPQEATRSQPESSGEASAPALGITSAPSKYTGLEGLSPLALRRIANDPKNPRAAQARVVLQQMEADARAATAETMAQPQYDPAQYGQ